MYANKQMNEQNKQTNKDLIVRQKQHTCTYMQTVSFLGVNPASVCLLSCHPIVSVSVTFGSDSVPFPSYTLSNYQRFPAIWPPFWMLPEERLQVHYLDQQD